MKNTQSKTLITAFTALALATTFAQVPVAFAMDVANPVSTMVPCATLVKFEGDVQLMDSSRTDMLETAPGVQIGCGSWVTIASGWALIRHLDGFRIHVGQNTFVQITDSHMGDNSTGDHLLLYKGQIAAQAGDGTGELKILTANGRVRLTRGTSVVIFNQQDLETQLISLDQTSTIENRFASERRIPVKAGESSILNFASARVVPGIPKAIAIAPLKEKLAELRLNEKVQKQALHVAKKREERVFATDMSVHPGESEPAERKPASNYSRSGIQGDDAPNTKINAELNQRWMGKITGDAGASQSVLFPKGHAKAVRVPSGTKVSVEDQSKGGNQKDDSREKVRLIEQLGDIKPE